MDTIGKAHIQSALVQLHYAFANKTEIIEDGIYPPWSRN